MVEAWWRGGGDGVVGTNSPPPYHCQAIISDQNGSFSSWFN